MYRKSISIGTQFITEDIDAKFNFYNLYTYNGIKGKIYDFEDNVEAEKVIIEPFLITAVDNAGIK